jgi:hypothetical protein
MNTLIIEPNNKLDYQLFVSLAKRLKVTFREEKNIIEESIQTEEQKDLLSLFGAFKDIDAGKMIQDIESSRTIKEIDTSWVE